jgi:hypothetical protein
MYLLRSLPKWRRDSPNQLNDGRTMGRFPAQRPSMESKGYRQSSPGRKGTIAGVEVM